MSSGKEDSMRDIELTQTESEKEERSEEEEQGGSKKRGKQKTRSSCANTHRRRSNRLVDQTVDYQEESDVEARKKK